MAASNTFSAMAASSNTFSQAPTVNDPPSAPPSVRSATLSVRSMRSQRSQAPTLSQEDRLSYLKTLGILNPDEAKVLRFLDDALAKSPLPAPWRVHRDNNGRIFFTNRMTSASTWAHPLEPSIRELTGVCRMCFSFKPEQREGTIQKLIQQWEGEARRDLEKWYAVKHKNGKEYFCNRDTSETMWTHPAEVVMPAHYIKIQAVQQLRDSNYLQELERTSDEKYRITSNPKPGKRSPSNVSVGTTLSKRTLGLEEDVKELSITNSSLRFELESVQKDLLKIQAMADETAKSSDTEERKARLISELNKQRQRAQACQSEWATLSEELAVASRNVIDAERAKSILEIKLAALHGDTRKKEQIIGAQQADQIPFLEKSFSEASQQRELLLSSDSTCVQLAEQLRQAESKTDALQRQVEATQKDGALTQAAAPLEVSQSQSNLPLKVREALAVQNSLRDRLKRAEEDLRQTKEKNRPGEEIMAQLAESQWKLDQLLQHVEASEREKSIAESKLLVLQKDILDIEDRLSLSEAAVQAASVGDKSALSLLEKELREAKATEQDLQNELRVAQTEATVAHAAAADPHVQKLVADLEAALSNERLHRMQLEEEAGKMPAGQPASELTEQLESTRAEALQAEEQASATEAQLAKERDDFARVWKCVEDAEKAKDILDLRIAAIERHFKDGRKDPQKRIDLLQKELGEERQRELELKIKAKELEFAKAALVKRLQHKAGP